MKTWLNKIRKAQASEEGFSLLEIVIAMAVLGVLAAVAIPLWVNSQNEVRSQQTKAVLLTAGMLLEQEAMDNNGLFPTYLPNELRDNKESDKFVYSFNDSRTAWCIQAPSSVGKLFVSSEDPKKVVSTPCTQDNIAEGSDTPWKAPTVTKPNNPTISSHTWPNNVPAATTTLVTGGTTCTLASEDQAEWNSKRTIQYRFKAVNTSRSNETLYTSWSSSATQTITLTSWIPDETVVYTAQARCFISNGIDYVYGAPDSNSVSRAIVRFTVASNTFTAVSAAWTSNTNFRATASWSNAYCPAGTMQSLLAVKDNSSGSSIAGSTTWVNWRNNATINTSSWSSGGTTTFSHTVGCLLSSGVRITSATVTNTANTPLRPPTTPSGVLTETTWTSTINATPTHLRWNAVTCVSGTPQYQVQTNTGTAVTSWSTAVKTQIDLTPNQSYTYRVAAKCVSGSNESIQTVSSVITFTAQHAVPQAPVAPTGLATTVKTSSTTKSNHTVSWSAVTCTNGAEPQYRVSRTKLDNTALTGNNVTTWGWQTGTSFSIPQSHLKYGSTVGFKVQAKCVNPVGVATEGGTSAEVTGTLGMPAPSAPRNVRNNNWGHFQWDAPSTGCVDGGKLQYYAEQTKYGNETGNWNTVNWQENVFESGLSKYTEGYPFTGVVKARCAGVNANSVDSGSGNTSWTGMIQNINIWSAGGTYGNYTIAWDNNACPTGTTQSVYTFSMDTTWGDYRNIAYDTWNKYHIRPVFPDGTYYWFRINVSCYTAWRSVGNQHQADRTV